MCGTSVPGNATLAFPVCAFDELVTGVETSDSAPLLIAKKLVCICVSASAAMLASYVVFGGFTLGWLLLLGGHGGVRDVRGGMCEGDCGLESCSNVVL